MEREEFTSLVARLSELAEADPEGYRRRVIMFGLLGYAYIGAMLAIAVGMVLVAAYAGIFMSQGAESIAVMRLAVPAVIVAATIARALQVEFPVPKGVELFPDEAPRLFALLDDLSSKLEATHFDRVLAAGDLQASVAEVPRFSIFGGSRHYLVIGMPLLAALSPEQVRAVLAHELGHRSRQHGRTSAWVYRIRVMWMQLLHGIHARRFGAFVFADFFGWYAPRFSAYSFVLARALEYEADREAANLTSTRTLGSALIALEVKNRYLQSTVWPEVQRQVETRKAPPRNAIAFVAQRVAAPPAREVASRYLTGALGIETANTDTHPALRDRLAAIGYQVSPSPGNEPQAPAPEPDETGLDFYLGPELAARVIEDLEEGWRSAVGTNWVAAHGSATRQRQRLNDITQLIERGEATDQQLRERAFRTQALDGPEAATAMLRDLVAADPDDSEAHFALGNDLLWQLNDEGLVHLELSAKHLALAPPAHLLIAARLRDLGSYPEARRHVALAEAAAEKLAERQRVEDEEPLIEPDDQLPE